VNRLSFANVTSLLALFVALAAGAYAAGLPKNSVKSKQIKAGAVKADELADEAVTSPKVADGSLLGKDFAPGQLPAGATGPQGPAGSPDTPQQVLDKLKQVDGSASGLDAALTGGFEIKKINFQVPFGTPLATVLVYPGIFRIDAQCQNSGDYLDAAAFTAKDNSAISVSATEPTGADDSDGVRDIASREQGDFDTNEAVEIDSTTELGTVGNSGNTTVVFSTQDGFVSVTQLQLLNVGTGCKMTGISIGG
jgi:hypothetical protein